MTAAIEVVTPAAAVSTGGARGGSGVGRRVANVGINAVIGVVAIGLAWQFIISKSGLTAYNRRYPMDIYRYLTASGVEADEARHVLIQATLTTARDASLGLLAGTIAAVLIAMAFNRWPVVEQGSMPVAMALRSVPLVAMTPLITLIFGRDILGVTVIAGIITFFPTLVNVSLALRSVTPSSIDLMRAYGASPGRTLRMVQLPSSLPALFASIRIAAPLALVGAYLAEYLSTGKGLGYLMLTASFGSDYDQMWAAVAIITFGAVILYQVISAIEQVVLARFAAEPAR